MTDKNQSRPQQTPYPGYGEKRGSGKILLQGGKRKNVPDPTVRGTLKEGEHSGPMQEGPDNDDIDRIMYLMNLNLQDRIKQRKGKKGKEALQGLFGGNRD